LQKSENKKKVFALVILFGFETKNFFGSGLYNKLIKEHKVIIFKRNFPTENFAEYIEKYDLDVVELDKKELSKKRLKSEDIFLSSRRAKQRINNIENFNYFKSDRKQKKSDYILGNTLVSKSIGFFTKYEINKYYYSEYLSKLYDNYEITDLIIAGYSSSESISLSVTAEQTNRNIYLMINSWKDFYVNDLIPFNPTKIFVWSDSMKEQLLSSNTHIEKDSVMVSGNPSFDRFFKYEPIHAKKYYATKYNFDVKRPLILYSMISPKAYAYEKESIELINQGLIKLYPDEIKRPILLLRRNPIDETVADEKYFTGNNVKYADNYFEASYTNAVFVQLEEGEVEWMDLLFHADININIASTVTLEALMMKTPVINIEFDKSGNKNSELARYANAPFYTSLHDRIDVSIILTIEDCMKTIKYYLENNIEIDDFYQILSFFDGQATKKLNQGVTNV
jgi:hypothetical protein